MKKIATLVILTALFTRFQAAADDSKTSQAILKVEGKINVLGYHVPQFYVNIYQDNDLLRTMKVGRTGVFDLVLNKNRLYTLEIEGIGYITKRVQINTKVPGSFAMLQTFGFDIYLAEEEAVKSADDFLLDFPVAQIAFSPTERGFTYNEHYTNYILNEHTIVFGHDETMQKLFTKK